MKCPKCDSGMEEGKVDAVKSMFKKDKPPFLLTAINKWYRVTRSPLGGFLETLTDPQEIAVYKCNKCGYLESYAKQS